MSRASAPIWVDGSNLKPSHGLEVVKSGVSVEILPFDPSGWTLFGRNRDVVSIGLDHTSISRIHAVIATPNLLTPSTEETECHFYLADMGSAQGTFLNRKKLLKSLSYEKLQDITSHTKNGKLSLEEVDLESYGFYRVYIGDCIQFGASTRFYFMRGPIEEMREEYDSENLQELRKKSEENYKKLILQQKKQEEKEISWGIRDYDEELMKEQEEEDSRRGSSEEPKRRMHLPSYLSGLTDHCTSFSKFSVNVREEDCKTVKEKDMFHKIRQLEARIEQMQQENRRILAKEATQEDGLTTGQQSVLTRNEDQIESLKQQATQLAKNLNAKFNESTTKTSSSQMKRKDEEDDDSDFLRGADEVQPVGFLGFGGMKSSVAAQAASSVSNATSKKVLSVEDIRKQLEIAQDRLAQTEKKLSSLQEEEARLQFELQLDDLDEIDAVVLKESFSENALKLADIQAVVADQRMAITGLESLLRIAEPTAQASVQSSAPKRPADQQSVVTERPLVKRTAVESVRPVGLLDGIKSFIEKGQTPPTETTTPNSAPVNSAPPVKRVYGAARPPPSM